MLYRTTCKSLMLIIPVFVFGWLLHGSTTFLYAENTMQAANLDLQPAPFGWNFTGAVSGYEHHGIFWVYNSGSDLAQNVAVRFYAGDPESNSPLGTTQTITEIPAQQARQVILTWTPTVTGIYTITAWIDPDNKIAEVDETNSLASIRVDVREPNLTWYVDQTAVESGDGRTPETAFRTIPEAIPMALTGDTIQVAAGVYAGNLSIPFNVSLVGAGSEVTTIQGGGTGSVIRLGDKAQINGFTIQGSGNQFWDAGIWINDNASPTIAYNLITGNVMGIVSYCFSEPCDNAPFIHHNIVVDNAGTGINLRHSGAASIAHNTVISNTRGGIVVGDAGSLIENNIITRNNGGLGVADGVIVRHNILWANGNGTSAQSLPATNLLLDPMLRDAANSDYRLYAGSPAIGSGNPAGTDMGSLPFAPTGTPPSNVTVEQFDDFSWRVTWVGSAPNYQLYLGTTADLYRRHIGITNTTTYVLRGLPGNIDNFVAFILNSQ